MCVCVSCLSGFSQWQSVFCHFFSVPRLSHFMLPCAGYYSLELWKSWPCALKHLTLSLSCPLSHPPLLLAAHSRSPGLEAPFPERTHKRTALDPSAGPCMHDCPADGWQAFWAFIRHCCVCLFSSSPLYSCPLLSPSLLLSHHQQLDSGLPSPPVILLSRKP